MVDAQQLPALHVWMHHGVVSLPHFQLAPTATSHCCLVVTNLVTNLHNPGDHSPLDFMLYTQEQQHSSADRPSSDADLGHFWEECGSGMWEEGDPGVCLHCLIQLCSAAGFTCGSSGFACTRIDHTWWACKPSSGSPSPSPAGQTLVENAQCGGTGAACGSTSGATCVDAKWSGIVQPLKNRVIRPGRS